jgi:hypothetical protein
MRSCLAHRAMAVAGVLLVFAALIPAAFAATNSFGPQSWGDGTTSGRYRSQVGNHAIKALNGCGSSQVTLELRVDVISNPDISEGQVTVTCNGSAGNIYGSINSFGSAYRGHFMQSHSTWYGVASDAHN